MDSGNFYLLITLTGGYKPSEFVKLLVMGCQDASGILGAKSNDEII